MNYRVNYSNFEFASLTLFNIQSFLLSSSWVCIKNNFITTLMIILQLKKVINSKYIVSELVLVTLLVQR